MAHLVLVESKPTAGFRLLRQAVRLGHDVTVLAHSLDPYLRFEGAEQDLAHAVRVVDGLDTTDPEAVLAALATGAPADGITTLSAGHFDTVAQVAARLGLPGERADVAELLRDKAAVRRRLAAADVPQPAFRETATVDDALAAAETLALPVVVKPADGYGSRGVGVAHTPEQVAELARAVLDMRDYGRSRAAAGRVLLEEYVPGPIVSCETLTVDGRHQPYGCTDRTLTPPPHPVELGGCFPAELPADRADESAVWEVCAAALDAVGVTRGHSHTEIVLGPDGPRIIEINGRLAGGPVPELMNLVLTHDVYRDVVELALGGSPAPGAAEAVGCVRTLTAPAPDPSAPAGTLAAIEVAAVRTSPLVAEVLIDAAPGQTVGAVHTNRDRLGFVLTRATDAGTARAAAERAAAHAVFDVRTAVPADGPPPAGTPSRGGD